MPKKIAIISKNKKKIISKYTKFDTINAPSFRYNDFCDEKLNFKYNRNILISLSVDLEASLSILELLSQTTIVSLKSKVLVNCHPTININKFKNFIQLLIFQT